MVMRTMPATSPNQVIPLCPFTVEIAPSGA